MGALSPAPSPRLGPYQAVPVPSSPTLSPRIPLQTPKEAPRLLRAVFHEGNKPQALPYQHPATACRCGGTAAPINPFSPWGSWGVGLEHGKPSQSFLGDPQTEAARPGVVTSHGAASPTAPTPRPPAPPGTLAPSAIRPHPKLLPCRYGPALRPTDARWQTLHPSLHRILPSSSCPHPGSGGD